MDEFHGTHQDTRIHPGQTFNLDYSLIQVFRLQTDLRRNSAWSDTSSGSSPRELGSVA
jgi:hypothetical protein